jgi:S1-C subfamily serine protease
MRLFLAVLLALGFSLPALSVNAAPPAAVDDPAGIARPAVVRISYHFITTDRRGQQVAVEESGSGMILNGNGFIVTNQHVVEDTTEVTDHLVTVELLDGRSFKADVVGADEESDVAVIKIPAGEYPTVEFADSGSVFAGEPVIAIGHTPLIDNPTLGRAGSVLGTNGQMLFPGGAQHHDLVRTNISIYPGDSGGALIDADGHVVGMNVIRLPDYQSGKYIEGMHIPANRVRSVAETLIAYGKVSRPDFGVSASIAVTPQLAQTYALASQSGVLIQQVRRNGPAFTAGVRVGDIITALDGVPLLSPEQLNATVSSWAVGQVVTVDGVHSDGTAFEVQATVGER